MEHSYRDDLWSMLMEYSYVEVLQEIALHARENRAPSIAKVIEDCIKTLSP
jgi:hypothetical protein